jgi:hypothetical protein
MSDSYIKVSMTGGPASYIGPDAVALFRVTVLRTGLRIYAKHKLRVNRGYSPSAMLKAASQITGRTYTRGQYLSAAADLTAWIEAMKAALPIIME